MIEVISTKEKARLRSKLKCIRDRNVALDAELMREVATIIDDVRRRGDAALIDLAARFDGVVMQSADIRVSEDALREMASKADGQVLEALRESIFRVRKFHEHERLLSWEFED